MAFTREELLAEKQRREMAKSLSSSQSMQQPENEQNAFWNAIDAGNKFGDKYLAPIGAGAINAIPDIAANIGNFALKPFQAMGLNAEIPRPHLERFLDPEHSRLAFGAGELAGGFGPASKVFGLAGKIPGLSKGLPAAIGKGALTGAAISPDEQRTLGAALGGAFPLIGKTIQQATKIPGATNKSLGKKIVSEVKNLKKGFKADYDSIFDMAEKSGLKSIHSSVKDKDLLKVLSEVDPKYYKGIKNYIQHKTPRHAHDAKSDLGKFIRKIESKKELLKGESNALKAARKAREILEKDLTSALSKKPEIASKYLQTQKKYATEMVPHLENTAIRKASLNPGQKGYINPSRLPPKLRKEASDPFMAHLRDKIPGTDMPLNESLYGKYPELEVNKYLQPKQVTGAVATGLGLLGLPYGVKKLFG